MARAVKAKRNKVIRKRIESPAYSEKGLFGIRYYLYQNFVSMVGAGGFYKEIMSLLELNGIMPSIMR
jgi:hypothetical protein